ncbi:MAG: PspC domain-containing protein, partial [Flavisolibacter sp.]
LYRDASDKLLGGVCAGLANYMNVDPAIVRLLFAIITLGGFGSGILIYIVLWILLPVRNLDGFAGKRFFRNPDDRVIAGVAGGLGAYFNKPSWLFRLLFAAPLVLNILFGILNGIFFMWERDIFPNIFIGSFSGTFILAYIVLWIVLPEARSPFEKMEMRGEKVDVNRIRQNVQEGMGDFKTRMENWGEEVKVSAQQFSQKAKDFSNTRGKTFASEVSDASSRSGCAHVIGVLFKAFFIFIAGSITLALFAALMAVIFGGVAWWPINNFLWSSNFQKMLAWGTLLLFFAVPIIAMMTWLIRRIARVKSRNSYMGWIFGGLWTAGWVFAILFAISIAKDLRSYERVPTQISMSQPSNGKLTVNVNEPEIRYSGGVWWIREDNTGWDITSDSLKYNNVKLRMEKSEDSLYKVTVYKYSFGKSIDDARERAERIIFTTTSFDSVLHISSGLGIDKQSKFRGQGVVIEIQIPVGKQIRFNESVRDAYNPWVIRSFRNRGGSWERRNRYETDWDYDEYFRWSPDTDYIMTTDGKLVETSKTISNEKGVYEIQNEEDRRRELENKERELERQQEEIRRERERLENLDRRDSITPGTGFIEKKINKIHGPHLSFIPTII